MDFLDKLNPEQREAVLHREGPVLILAGAGSGKTRVITFRIAYLIGDGHAEPDQVLAVTFTNKASQEMRERVEALIGDAAGRVWLSTFHSLCARLLRREAPKINLSRDFVIYDSSDQVAVVKQAQRELGIDDKLVPPRAALSRISQAKNRMEGPDSMRGGWNIRDEQIAKIYERYLSALKDANALDFDDLLLKTVELMETSEQTREFYARKFKYVMVDEYQDTNRPQYMLIKRLAELHRNIAVVGDPDQSIYKWRGADLRNILDFEQDFGDAKVVRLEQNYRSTQTILDAATAVISQNRNRKDKKLWTDRKGGAKIVYFRGNDELEEADFITRTLKQYRSEDVDATMAILYRTNAQSRAIEDALMREGLPYKIIGGVRFYERKEIKDALAYLKLIMNPHDDVSLRRVINVPARGIGKGVMESLQEIDPNAVRAEVPAAARRRRAGSDLRTVALGQAGLRSGRGHARAARDRRAPQLQGSDRRPRRRRPQRIRLHHHGEDARSERLPHRPPRGEQRGGERTDREPDGARVRRARVRDPRTGGLARRLCRSPVAAVGSGRRVGNARSQDLDDDHARRQGARVPPRRHRRTRRRVVPALAFGGKRRGARGGTPAVLRRHDPRRITARAHERGPPPCLRRVPGDRSVALPGRDPGRTGRADRAGVRVLTTERVQPWALRVQDEPVRTEGQGSGSIARDRSRLQVRRRGSERRQPAVRDAREARAVRRRHRRRRSKNTTTT